MGTKSRARAGVIPDDAVEDAVVRLMRRAAILLPSDVEGALRSVLSMEDGAAARGELSTMLDNAAAAREDGVPLCQDTGMPVFLLRIGSMARSRDIPSAVRRGVERATAEVPLRPSVVHPLTRENPGTNTGPGVPHLVVELVAGRDDAELWALPKGAGSENMSRLAMLPPAAGSEGVARFVVEAVLSAGARPCPPTVVGLGVGGCSDEALWLARRALLRPLGSPQPDPLLAELERRCADELNGSGLGPMGLGGRTTVLAVHALAAHCHTASLPVGVVVQCWADRRAGARISADGRVEELEGGPVP
jgi:fumarate hydratase subunit alpha